MKTLIMKEKDILDKEIISVGFYVFFLSFLYIMLSKSGFSAIFLLFAIIGGSLILIIASMSYEELFKNEKLLNSLPIIKEDIVIARYISTILMSVFTSLLFICFVIILGVSLKSGREFFKLLDIKNMILAISVVMLLASIITPVYYSKHSRMRYHLFSLPLILVLIRNTGEKLNWNREAFFNFFSKPIVILIVLAISLILYYLSYELSKRLYLKKEFL